jgi:hypothetical protein
MKNSTLLLPSHIYRRRPENNGKVNASIKAHTERTFGEITMMLMMALKKIISYTFSLYIFLHRNYTCRQTTPSPQRSLVIEAWRKY